MGEEGGGRLGLLTYEDGEYYIGTWKLDKKEGVGVRAAAAGERGSAGRGRLVLLLLLLLLLLLILLILLRLLIIISSSTIITIIVVITIIDLLSR